MFSRRTQFEPEPNRLTQALTARRLAGLPVCDLTVTNPTLAGLPLPWSELHAILADAVPGPYTPDSFGLLNARQAVVGHLTRLGAQDLKADQIVLCASTSEAYGHLLTLLCDPGDNVLVPEPSYPLFGFLAQLHDVELRTWPSYFSDGWQIDWQALERSISRRTRAIVAVSPNNPTGSVLRRADLARLTELCTTHGLALIVDEVFADTIDAGDHQVIRTVAGHTGCLTFALGGLSKTCLLPHVKLAWLAVSGPQGLREAALGRLEVVADTYLSVASPIQRALPALLALVPQIRSVLRARLDQNRQTLARQLAGTVIGFPPADGGWSALVRLPVRGDDRDWAEVLLETSGVLVQPGWYFDLSGDGWIVLSLLSPPLDFSQGVQLLAEIALTV